MLYLLSCEYENVRVEAKKLEERAEPEAVTLPRPFHATEVQLPTETLPERMAIVVVIDGIRVEEISSTAVSPLTTTTGEEWASHLWSKLAPEATIVRSAIIPGSTTTSPSHAELLSGTSLHLANLPLNRIQTTLYRPELPTLVQFADQLGNTIFIGDTNLLGDSAGSVYPGYISTGGYAQPILDQEGSEDGAVMDEVLSRFKAEYPILTVINLHEVDIEGHRAEEGVYAQKILEADARVAQLYEWVKMQPDLKDRVLFVVTSDHGRHRTGAMDPIWAEHGDSCSGCREVPLFVAGPPVVPGQLLEQTWLEYDTTALVAAWLGVEMPHGTGLLPEGVFELESKSRQGEVSVSVAGEHQAVKVWQDDPEHRSRVEVDGEVISSPEALMAETPILAASGEELAVCWRELTVDYEEDEWPWVPRCLKKTQGIWEDIGFPLDEVKHSFKPSLLWENQNLWVAWSQADWNEGNYGQDTIQVARYSTAGWESMGEKNVEYPVHPMLALGDAGWSVVTGVSATSLDSRTNRGIYFTQDRGVTTFSSLSGLAGEGDTRAERAALRVEGAIVEIGALVLGDQGAALAVWKSLDGTSWTEPVSLPAGGDILPHLSPCWDGDRLVWGVLFAPDEAGFCAISLEEAQAGAAPICISAGSAWIDSFAVEQGTITASVYSGEGLWEVQQFAL